MTEDEKRQQKAMLLLEYQEAEDELANLQERAQRLAGNIDEISIWIHRAVNPDGVRPHDPRTANVDANIRTNLKAYREILNIDSMLTLIDEIRASEKRLKELASRKQSLGLK